ncbi:hypothetical protein Tco_1545220, partial [Tanacetum coccineum]
MRDFQECVEDMEVADVNSTGLKFTWNQKPKGNDGILKKIDRIMANLEFNSLFMGACAVFQPYRISDHSPAILRGYPNPKPQEFVVDPNDFPAIGANLATTVPRAVSSPKVVENEKTHDVTMHSDGSARVPLNNTSTCHDDAFGSDSSS